MKITDIRIYPVLNNRSIKANASITFDEQFAVSKMKVIENSNGHLFVSFPSEKYEKDGETKYTDICFPVTKELRNHISESIILAYKEALDGEITNRSNESKKDPELAVSASSYDFDDDDDLPF